MTAFELVAKLVADTSGFDSAMGKAEKSGKNLKNSLENTFGKIKTIAAGALSVAAIKKGVDSVISLANEVSAAGDRIDKQSQALGLSRKAFQEWDYILGQNGASIDSLGVSMKTLNSLVLSAQEGGKEAKDSFAQLGLGIHELDGLNMEQQFEAVVRAFQKMPAGAKKSALAVQMFGRNGMELLPLLNQADTSIDELRQRAEELGLIMSDDAVDAAVVYGDSLDDLKRTFNGFKYSVGSQVLPILTTGIQKITSYAGKLHTAYRDNGLAGVWQTLVSDIKNIKWPTWEDVKNAATKAWDKIKEGAKNLAGLVFGKAEDGSVAWPDVTKMVKDFGTWWSETALPALQGAMKWTLTLFGVPEETAEDISKLIGDWWNTKVESVKKAINWVLNLPGMPPHEAGEELGKIIGEWWEGIRGSAESVLKWALGLFGIADSEGTDTKEMISTWWTDKVVPFLTGALDFVLGLFGLPPASEMGEKIKAWWKEVTDYVGKLVYNATVNLITGGSSTGDDSWSSNSSSNYNPHGFNLLEGLEDGSNAKGLNYVPFDGYLAKLHRGEEVLTASQARRYRSGSGGGVDIVAFAQSMIAAVREGMDGAEVNSYMDGRRVTGGVNRRTMNQLKARRFQT